MKKITKEQAEKIELLQRNSRHSKSPLFNAVRNLQVGEFLLVDNKDYKRKTPLATAISGSVKGRGTRFSVKTLADKSGYLVKRIE